MVGRGKHFGGQRKAIQSLGICMQEMGFQELPVLKEGLAKTGRVQWASALKAALEKRSQEQHVEGGKEVRLFWSFK